MGRERAAHRHGTVVLIDFDLEFQTDGPLEELMALDLVVALRAVLRWTSDEHRSVRQIVEWWDLGGGRQYDRAVLATMVLNVDCAYRCGSVPTAQAVDALDAWLRATDSLALALSR
jgi:hypothetical protein